MMSSKFAFIRYIFVALCMSVMACVGVHAESVKIHGRITDGDNRAMEFVTVRVAGTAIGTMSGLDGEYALSAAESDTITLVFTCIGYKEQQRKLVDAKGDVTLNMRMFRTTRELQEVQVTEVKKQLGSMQAIDMSGHRLTPDVSGGSVESLVTTMAGVTSSNEMSSQYSVRGGSYDENLVYINGIEVYRPQLISSGQQEGLSIINPDLVGKVNFSTGGFGSEYGDRMSSVLDITYRQPEAFEGSAALSLMGGSLSLGTSSKHFSQLHGVRYKRNNSVLSSMETKGEYDPNFFDYQTNLNYDISSKWRVSFLGNIAINNYKFTPVNRETSFGTAMDAKKFTVYFDGQEKDRFETYFGALSLQYAPSKRTNFTLFASGYLTNELVAYDISGEYWLDQAGTSGSDGIGGELGVGRYHEHARDRLKASVFTVATRGYTAVGNHQLSYGLQYNHESIYERAGEWERRDSAGFSLPTDPNLLRVVYNLTSKQDFTSNRVSMHAQDTYRMQLDAGFLSVTGGLRFSYWDFNNELLVSPRVNVGFVPANNDRWALRFATGLYYQSPFYKEYRQIVTDDNNNSVVQLNDDIKSQRSWHFILGSDYTFRAVSRPFKLSAEAYYKALSNLIPYEIDNLKLVYDGVNSSNGYAMGLDFKLFGQFVPGSDSWISFSLMKTQEKLRGVNVPRPNDRRYSFALYFTDYFPGIPKLKLNLKGIFMDGLPTTAPRSTRDVGYFRTPAYKRVDLGVSYALLPPLKEGETRTGIGRHLKAVWLGLDCFNLFDISNVSSYYWVTDVNELQYAVPNYLTRRQINLRLSVEF
jgi:hypothetical protein